MGNFFSSSGKYASVPLLAILLSFGSNSFAVTGSTTPTLNSGTLGTSWNANGGNQTSKAAMYATNSYCISNMAYSLSGPSGGTNISTITGSWAPVYCITAGAVNTSVSMQINPSDMGTAATPTKNGSPSGRSYPTPNPIWNTAAMGSTSSSWADMSNSGWTSPQRPISDAWTTTDHGACNFMSYSNPITDYWVFNAPGTYTQTISFLFTNTTNQVVYIYDNAEASCYVGGPGGTTITVGPNATNVPVTLSWTATVGSGWMFSQILGIAFVNQGAVQ